MQSAIQNLLNFVNNKIVNDKSVVGLCGVKKKTEYIYINIPLSFKNARIQNIENNYLLI